MAGFTADDHDSVMSEINMVPLIDVMLVLLIVFIVTIPVMQQSVPVELPRASAQPPAAAPPPALRLSVRADGAYWLDEQPVTDAALAQQLRAAAARDPASELHILGDRAVRYERVAQAMSAAQQAGLTRMGFITEPERTP